MFKLNTLKKSLPNTVTKNEPDTQLHNVLYECTVRIYNLQFSKQFANSYCPYFPNGDVSFGASQGFLGRRDALESLLPLHPRLSGRGSPPGDRVSIISYLSLHPIHIQFHSFNFLVDFGKEYTG